MAVEGELLQQWSLLLLCLLKQFVLMQFSLLKVWLSEDAHLLKKGGRRED